MWLEAILISADWSPDEFLVLWSLFSGIFFLFITLVEQRRQNRVTVTGNIVISSQDHSHAGKKTLRWTNSSKSERYFSN